MQIENIVSSGSFNQEIDLQRLSESLDCIHYGHNRYPAAYARFDGHSITIYHTGKYIMPGMRSVEQTAEVFDKLKSMLSPYIDVSLSSDPIIRNIVASSNIGYDLDLRELCLKMYHGDLDAVYEPESFPGLILKTSEVTFNVFQSGKFLILGCTSIECALSSETLFKDLISNL